MAMESLNGLMEKSITDYSKMVSWKGMVAWNLIMVIFTMENGKTTKEMEMDLRYMRRVEKFRDVSTKITNVSKWLKWLKSEVKQ
jgi:hypothetical protein